jgi:CRP/FNR family transcriptional regulator
MHYRRGELLYSEGERATGAYIVVAGRVKLVATSSAGKALIVRIAAPGDIVGLSAALARCQNDTNAVALQPAVALYVPTDALHRLLTRFTDLSLWSAKQLSLEYFSLCRELSLVGLRRSAMSKLAQLLLGLFDNAGSDCVRTHVECRLTHEEMAQMIGTSRETVTRMLRNLREGAIATLKGDTLRVNDFKELRALAY